MGRIHVAGYMLLSAISAAAAYVNASPFLIDLLHAMVYALIAFSAWLLANRRPMPVALGDALDDNSGRLARRLWHMALFIAFGIILGYLVRDIGIEHIKTFIFEVARLIAPMIKHALQNLPVRNTTA